MNKFFIWFRVQISIIVFILRSLIFVKVTFVSHSSSKYEYHILFYRFCLFSGSQNKNVLQTSAICKLYLKATSRNYFYNKSIKMHLVVIRNQRISRYDTFSEFSNMQFAIQLEVKFEDVDCEIFRLNIPNKTRLRNFLFAVCFRLNRLRFARLYFRTWSLFFFFCNTLLTKHGRIRSRTQVISFVILFAYLCDIPQKFHFCIGFFLKWVFIGSRKFNALNLKSMS